MLLHRALASEILRQIREHMILLRQAEIRQIRISNKKRQKRKCFLLFLLKLFKKVKENRDDDLKATLRRLRFLRTQRFREMKPIDATNSKLAKEEEKLKAMDAQIGELERGNHVCLARVEQFKNKFCAESARRSHLKTTFVQAGEEIKKLTQVCFFPSFVFFNKIIEEN